MADRVLGANPLADNAEGYATDVLGGRYLNSNPHLQGMIDQTGRSVRDQVNSVFSRAGRTGGSDHSGMLITRLADAENSLRYQDYANERTAMNQMAGMSGQIGAARYAGLTPLLQAMQGAMAPVDMARGYAGATSGLVGPYTTTTQSQGLGSTLANIAGLGLMAFGGGGLGGLRLGGSRTPAASYWTNNAFWGG
jgi:hypothetical protein